MAGISSLMAAGVEHPILGPMSAVVVADRSADRASGEPGSVRIVDRIEVVTPISRILDDDARDELPRIGECIDAARLPIQQWCICDHHIEIIWPAIDDAGRFELSARVILDHQVGQSVAGLGRQGERDTGELLIGPVKSEVGQQCGPSPVGGRLQ